MADLALLNTEDAPPEQPAQPWGDDYPVSGALYYWCEEPDVLAQKLRQKVTQWRVERMALDSRARLNWYTYYNLDNGRAAWQDNLYPEGELGEKVRLRSGLVRNLVQHILVSTNSVQPSLDPLAKNSDAASNKQIIIGRSIAQEVMNDSGGYAAADKATEFAEVLDGGFVEGEWDELAGGEFSPGVPRGGHKFNVLTPLDIFFDLAQTGWTEHSYIGTRKWRNRFDLIKLHPDLESELLSAPRKVFAEETRVYELPSPVQFESADTELVEVFTFYHRKCAALPFGRMITFISPGHMLSDGPLPYQKMPVWRVSPAEVLGTSFSYGPVTSLGSTQEAFNKMLSMTATTLFTHGVSNIGVAKGANIDATDLGGGQRVYEMDIPPGGSIDSVLKPIQMTELPKEVLEFAQVLNSLAEQDAGLNKIVRGDPGGVTAGVALSLYQAMAQTFQGPLENSRKDLIHDMVLWSWEALREHSANMERWVQVVGEGHREALEQFCGKDLDGLERLDVSLGNPLTRTPGGRVQVVQMLKQDGQPLPPQVIMDVLSTGVLETATEPDSDELDLIRQENTMLLNGQEPSVMLGQDDALHIFHHVQVTFSPDLTSVPQRKLAAEQHLRAHLAKMSQGDLVLMARRGVLQQGFASPMFQHGPAPEAAAGGKDAPKGVPGTPSAEDAAHPKPESPAKPSPLSGPSPQQ